MKTYHNTFHNTYQINIKFLNYFEKMKFGIDNSCMGCSMYESLQRSNNAGATGSIHGDIE